MSTFVSILEKYSAINTHEGTDKITSHSYGQVYESLFDFYKETPRVLEVGFDGGASLLAYAEYFSKATIYGIDLEDHRLPAVKQHPRICTFIGDATKPETVNHFGLTYDLIIEDASHLLRHQLQHFEDYSPFVNPGGLYIIEDVHEDNMEALESHLRHYSDVNGFDLYIYDLRDKKGRFDDILFVFQKRTESSSYIKQIQSLSKEKISTFVDPLRATLTNTHFQDNTPKENFIKWLQTCESREASIFFTRIFGIDEWKRFSKNILHLLL